MIGPGVLPDVYLVANDTAGLRADALPREVALKASHASGGSVLVAELAPSDNVLREPPAGWARFLVRPDRVDWAILRALFDDWLGRPYKPRTHWPNGRLTPRVLAEQLLSDVGKIPRDFKLFTFDGQVRIVVVDTDRYLGHVRAIYTPNLGAPSVRTEVSFRA